MNNRCFSVNSSKTPGKTFIPQERLEQEKPSWNFYARRRWKRKNNFGWIDSSNTKGNRWFRVNRTDKLKSLNAALSRTKMISKESERLSRAERDVDTSQTDLTALADQISRTLIAIKNVKIKRAENEKGISGWKDPLKKSKVRLIKLRISTYSTYLHSLSLYLPFSRYNNKLKLRWNRPTSILLRFDHEISALQTQNHPTKANWKNTLARTKISAEIETISGEISGIERNWRNPWSVMNGSMIHKSKNDLCTNYVI